MGSGEKNLFDVYGFPRRDVAACLGDKDRFTGVANVYEGKGGEGGRCGGVGVDKGKEGEIGG